MVNQTLGCRGYSSAPSERFFPGIDFPGVPAECRFRVPVSIMQETVVILRKSGGGFARAGFCSLAAKDGVGVRYLTTHRLCRFALPLPNAPFTKSIS